jgi:hypothetical protein
MTRSHADRTWRLLRSISRRINRSTENEGNKERKQRLQMAAMNAETTVMAMLSVVDSLPLAKSKRRLWK